MKLSDPQGAHTFVQSGSVHVDGGTQRKNETADAFIYTIVLLNAPDSSWQSGSTIKNEK